MKKVIEILSKISATSSRKDKEVILKEHKDNEEFRVVLDFVFNPFIKTGIADKKINKHKKEVHSNEFNNFFEVMQHLVENNTGKDKDIKKVLGFIQAQPQEEQELYEKMVTKNLKIGISNKTINLAFNEDFIPYYEIMSGEKYHEYQDKIKHKIIIITKKLDGIRCNLIKKEGQVIFKTREGQVIEGLVELIEESKNLPDNYVYDGELLKENPDNLPSGELYEVTKQEVLKDGHKHGVQFHMFDMIRVDEFEHGMSVTSKYEGTSSEDCLTRKEKVRKVIEDNTFKFITLVEMLYIGEHDEEVIKVLLQQMIDDKEEGLMINVADSFFQFKRTQDLLKVKEMQEGDFRIIGFKEGKGKIKGTLGKIVVEFKDNEVECGSGFDEKERNEIWNNQDDYHNKIVKVQYFGTTYNKKTKKESLRFPIFKEIRHDKSEPNY